MSDCFITSAFLASGKLLHLLSQMDSCRLVYYRKIIAHTISGRLRGNIIPALASVRLKNNRYRMTINDALLTCQFLISS